MHTYGRGADAIMISLIDVPSGPVRILSSSPSMRVRHTLSHAEFDRMWGTLLASGARKLDSTSLAKRANGANNYVFSLADLPAETGSFVVPKTLIVPSNKASPSVIAVARKIRGLVEPR